MKNCLEFNVLSLTKYITVMGIFDVIHILNHFAVLTVTNVVTLDRSYLKTTDLAAMMYCATVNEYGYNLMAPSKVVNFLIELLTNPGSPEEAYKMNTALKALDLKKNGNANKFYELMREALSRRLLFQKLSQIYAPLVEEIKTNKELLIILVNNKLIDMSHLEELAGSNETPLRITHYIVHNVNSYGKLRRFCYLCTQWCRDTYMIEQILEIKFEIEMFQMTR